MEEEKVRVKVQKVLLESERRELRAKRRRRFLIFLLCFLLLIVGCVIGYTVSSIQRGTSIAAFKREKLDKITSYFKSTWLYKNDYEDLETTMEDSAFYGMTTFEEDPYSTYMSKDEMESFAASINNNYVGIGAQYSYTGGIGEITRVFKGSPAEKGGLLAGDILYLIDGKSIEGLDSEQVKERIIGEEGTQVKITVLRSGKEIELTFIRGAIEYTSYAEDRDSYVYLNIMSFGQSTADECIKYLDNYKDKSSIIIDLRDNTGGYQDAVQEVAGLFLGQDVTVLNETDNNNVTRSFNTIVKRYYDNFKKIVVLTNENTASAAEVLTIALKEMHENTTQVGTVTYGKGVVQSSFYLEDGSALKITSSYWTSPKGTSINKVGVIPDIEVKQDDIMYETIYALQDDEVYGIDTVSPFAKLSELGLEFIGYDIDRVDGYFDKSLEDAVIKFQEDNRIEATGLIDKDTYEAILSSVTREYSSNPLKDKQLQKAIEVLGE